MVVGSGGERITVDALKPAKQEVWSAQFQEKALIALRYWKNGKAVPHE